jgi:hypothetical protein
LNDEVDALAVYDPGDGSGPALYAGGWFHSGATGNGITRWNLNRWVPPGSFLVNGSNQAVVDTMTVCNCGGSPQLYVGGGFMGTDSGLNSRGVISWNGSSWSALGSGLTPLGTNINPSVDHLASYDSGHGAALYVAGSFATAGGVPVNHIAMWDGVHWSSMNGGVDAGVDTLAVWDDGSGSKLYVASFFMTTAGGVPVSKIATWDGTSWAPMSVPLSTSSNAMLAYDDGRGPALFASGETLVDGVYTKGISRFDGTSWSALGGGINGDVNCLAAYDDGSGHGADLYAAGLFFLAGGGILSVDIARWLRCAGPIDSTCPGDQTLLACPCSNNGQPGHGCDNSAMTGGAFMVSFGTTNPDTLRFVTSGELSHSLSILLQSSSSTLSTLAFGDGLRCTGGHLLRLFAANAVNGTSNVPGQGNPSISARSAAMGDPLNPGAIRLYQIYYRDALSTCGHYFNASNATRVVW